LDQPAAKFVWQRDKNDPNLWVLVQNPSCSSCDPKTDPLLWYSQPDNFFGRYQVTMNSPLVTFYVTGQAYVNGVPSNVVDGPALDNLIGVNWSPGSPDPGGWLGFLKGKSNTASADDFFNSIYEDVDADTSPTKGPEQSCNKTTNTLEGAGTGFLSSLAMAIPMFGTGAGAVAGVIAIVAGTAAGAIDGASKC
jgi:hypothetical protein